MLEAVVDQEHGMPSSPARECSPVEAKNGRAIATPKSNTIAVQRKEQQIAQMQHAALCRTACQKHSGPIDGAKPATVHQCRIGPLRQQGPRAKMPAEKLTGCLRIKLPTNLFDPSFLQDRQIAIGDGEDKAGDARGVERRAGSRNANVVDPLAMAFRLGRMPQLAPTRASRFG
jgi:hypothetical protein